MRTLALTGGIGGAKLAVGLANELPADELAFLVNTGDDFEHFGLRISPDIDTLAYTLSGLVNPAAGWGRRDESWRFMETLEALGGETWFRLGDRDLALHALRRERLAAGATLTAVTRDLCRRLGVAQAVLPMSDDLVSTIVQTNDGPLAFQHYFVRDRCAPAVTGFEFDGIDAARPSPSLRQTLQRGLDAIVICPSNPFVSIEPILKVPGMTALLRAANAPIVAVSPIVGDKAIKGPTAKMMRELSIPATALAVARRYRGLIDGFVLDEQDASSAAAVRRLGIAVAIAQTVMTSLQDRIALARETLAFAAALETGIGAAAKRRD